MILSLIFNEFRIFATHWSNPYSAHFRLSHKIYILIAPIHSIRSNELRAKIVMPMVVIVCQLTVELTFCAHPSACNVSSAQLRPHRVVCNGCVVVFALILFLPLHKFNILTYVSAAAAAAITTLKAATARGLQKWAQINLHACILVKLSDHKSEIH